MSTITYQLLEGECTACIHVPSVTTATRYRGHAPLQYLRNRLSQILIKNPWLAGRLKKEPNGTIALHAPCPDVAADKQSAGSDGIADMDRYLVVVNDVHLRGDETYEELVGKLAGYGVKRGVQCIDEDEVLFRLVVVQPRGRKEFFIICSMSHVLGDGYTFYRIYAMLDMKEAVISLQCSRVQEFVDGWRELAGNSAVDWATNIMLPLSLQITTLCRPILKPQLLLIDKCWVEAEKQKFAERKAKRTANQTITTKEESNNDSWVDFVSTNDILTSWFLNRCGTPMGSMAINFRDRVCGVKDEHAGNYEGLLMLNSSSDFALPEDIRRALQCYCGNSCSGPPSYLWDWYKYLNFALSTIWAGMYHHVHLPQEEVGECEHVIHMPLMSLGDMSCFPHAICIFRTDEHNLAATVGSRSIASLEDDEIGTVITEVPC